MILEGIVTSTNEDGTPNIAPMGPVVDRGVTRLELRPFKTSKTFENLARTHQGVFHVTDDVEMLARAAIGCWDRRPDTLPCSAVSGWVLTDVCRWLAFRVVDLDSSGDRCRLECEIVDQGRFRDFFGFNRAKHAVLEAAILATRIGILAPEQIREELQRLESPVRKTAGDQEQRAFDLVKQFIASRIQT